MAGRIARLVGPAGTTSLLSRATRARWLGSGRRLCAGEEAREREASPAGTPGGNAVEVKPAAEREPLEDDEQDEQERRGAVGGFMRGLFGGREVAAEDEIKKAEPELFLEVGGMDRNETRRKELQVVPGRRRRRDDDEDAEGGKQTIRDRLFSRFGGSAFIRGAMEARERISERIDESDNPVINFFRDMYARMFAETEMGQALREIRVRDPDFRIYDFLRDTEHDYIPKVLGAYLSGDLDALQGLCTQDGYEVLAASIKEQSKEGIKMDPSILHIGDVELTTAKFLHDEPVLIVSFAAQQINCLRDRDDNVIEGKPDDIRAVYYIWALVRDDDDDEDGDGAQDQEEQADTGSESGTAAGEGPGEDAEGGDGADKAKKKGAKRRQEPPPWKMMEMVIRGAHSTI